MSKKIKMVLVVVVSISLSFYISSMCFAAQTIVAKKVNQAPVIDGRGDDAVWALAEGIITHDKIADIDVTLKAVYTEDTIFFLVVYPDADESREHKTWIWNQETEMYDRGSDREDMFVFKWSLERFSVDLGVFSEDNYTADIWFWKACRTDPVGYADDKTQFLNRIKISRSKMIISRLGTSMFLERRGDEGMASYKDTLFADYRGDRIPHFEYRTPTGSRADIKAKGIWSDGHLPAGEAGWTIEFSRALDTGHTDDIQFSSEKVYQFGVSRYEISGRDPDPTIEQPLYASGDIAEDLYLKFE